MSPPNANSGADRKTAKVAKKNTQAAEERARPVAASTESSGTAGPARFVPVADMTAGTTTGPEALAPTQPRARKHRPDPSSPGAEDLTQASTHAPAAKKQKANMPKPQASSAQPAGNSLLSTNTAFSRGRGGSLSATPPAPRPRGRPPGSGAGNSARREPGAGTAGARPKSEIIPPSDNIRRPGKKGSNEPAQPWEAPVEGGKAFVQDETSLLENGLYSDATIICLKEKFKVHRSVVCTRSKWFFNALNGDSEGGQTGVVNLHTTEKEDVQTLLRYIYSGKPDLDKFGIDKGSFVMYARLYNLGQSFEYKPLCDDALTLLGQYCDKKLVDVCSYEVGASGRKGVVDELRGNPRVFIDDLLQAIEISYDQSEHSTSLQSLFASFVWAGRDRLFHREELVHFADKCPRFGNDMFKLMLGHNPCQWFPSANISRTMCTSLDHSRKTQHPDRCECCDEVFDEAKIRKALYNPFNVIVRTGAWCAPCVEKHKGDAPLWRTPAAKDDDE